MEDKVRNCFLSFILLIATLSCGGNTSHMASAVNDGDSIPFMTAHGISNLISDSGIVRYKIIAEEWLMYDATSVRPSRWDFLKGFFMQKYDNQMNTESYIRCDTAYCHHDDLWEFRGRVLIRNVNGSTFRSEELFWDMSRHELYSSLYVHIQEPLRELEGYNFRSDERMTRYTIYNSNGFLPVEDVEAQPTDSI